MHCNSHIKSRGGGDGGKNLQAFYYKYNWNRINYPPGKDDWKNFEKNYLRTALKCVIF